MWFQCGKFFKTSIKNLKNITKSLSRKHQIPVAYHWEPLTAKGVESGPVKTKIVSDVENGAWGKHEGVEHSHRSCCLHQFRCRDASIP